MRKSLNNKIRSQTGASITFALLIFLVCTVLCSVILAAATASSGRMSGIAEADQRYYAVTSAAELLEDVFKAHPVVSIVEITETEYATTYENGVAGTSQAGASTTKVYIVPNKKASEISGSDYSSDSLLKEKSAGNTLFSENTLFRNSSIQVDAAKNVYNGTTSSITNRALAIGSSFYSDAGLSRDLLAVTIMEKLDADGKITLTLYNTYNTEAPAGASDSQAKSDVGSRYTLVMLFDVNTSVTTSSKTEVSPQTYVSENKYIDNMKETVTTITTLEWTFAGVM